MNDTQLASSSDLDALLGMSQIGAIKIDPFGMVLEANEYVSHLMGYTTHEMQGRPLRFFFPSLDLTTGFDRFEQISKQIEAVDNEIEGISDQGKSRLFKAQFVQDQRKTKSGVLLLQEHTSTDSLSSLVRYQRELNRLLLEHSNDAILLLNRNGLIEHANPASCELLDPLAQGLVGRPVLYLSNLLWGTSTPERFQEYLGDVQRLPLELTVELKNQTSKDNTPLLLKLISLPSHQKNEQKCLMIAQVFRSLEVGMNPSRHIGLHDPITSLLNRSTFERYLTTLIETTRETKKCHFLAYIELFDYQEMREVWGGTAADALLHRVGQLWKTLVPDSGYAARLGSDKFVLLIEDVDPTQIADVGETIITTFNRSSFPVGDKEASIAISLGVNSITAETESAVEALFQVAQMCVRAKQSGRNRMMISAEDAISLEHKRTQLEWIEKLKSVLKEGTFNLYCQPIQPTYQQDRTERSFEVLARLEDHEGELILPGRFIPTAEQFGLIGEVDRWILTRVVSLLANHPKANVRLSVNLSGQTISDETFLPWMMQLLDTHKINPRSLTLELTESAAVTNMVRARELIDTLRARGCKFALDDFGTGLCSFAYLKNLPVDFLKIDTEFVHDMEFSNISYSMVSAINHVGHLLNIQTIAEGAETEASVQMLYEIGVDYLQGFAISKPFSIEQVFKPELLEMPL